MSLSVSESGSGSFLSFFPSFSSLRDNYLCNLRHLRITLFFFFACFFL
ncbi:MAG: hypothetical protein GQF41_2193 [Candidatus Rifleibacterium amylolyticum]|nr:MAG: hypothetical protein GQF41_2193 [Candidatus Rifleibacterium amylolyticum]